jgi:hypothetical protein
MVQLITRLVVGRLFRADAADVIADSGGGPDVVALRDKVIRRNLEEMAADSALGLVTRPRMLARRPTSGWMRSAPRAEAAARENELAPLVAAGSAAAGWETLSLARQRAIIHSLMIITMLSSGKGARRAFDPATVKIASRKQS